MKGEYIMILTHYYPKIDLINELTPKFLTSNITEYSEKEQHIIAEQLSHCSGRALNRFKRFNNYIRQRNETEKWLFSAFLNAGGCPVSLHPFYFILGESQQLKHDFGSDAKTIQLDTNLINYNHISFTLGDSVGVYISSAQKKIYLLDQIEELLSAPEFIQWQMNPLQSYHRYIEAQLWDKHYLNECIL